MLRRKRVKLTADSFADPLARRIFIRSQREHRRSNIKNGLLDGAIAGARVNGNAFLGVILLFFVLSVWAVFEAIFEEIVIGVRRIGRRRKNRSSKPVIVTHYREV